MQGSAAIVLAMFGTTVDAGLRGLLAVRDAVARTWPRTPVRMAFTSDRIRASWRKRAVDPQWRLEHADISADILHVQGPLAVLASLQEQGHNRVVVQPVHMVPAEEFHDLAALVRGLAAIRGMQAHSRPFAALALGRPALGGCDPRHPASADIRRVAAALAADADQARREQAALVYMAHGSRHFPVGGLYLEFAACMRELYPEVRTLIGTIDAFPSLDPVVNELHDHRVERVLLKPLLIASGMHAARDLAGPGADSWQSRLTAAGFTTVIDSAGLGEQPAFCQVLVEHIAEAAAAAGLELA